MHDLYRTYYQVSIQLESERTYAAKRQRNAEFAEALQAGEERRGARFQIGRLFRRFSFGFLQRTRRDIPAHAPIPCYSPVEPVS